MLVPAPVFWQLHSRLKALLASQSLSQTSAKLLEACWFSSWCFLQWLTWCFSMDFDQCLATGVFTNYFGGGDSVFSWQVASWRRPFMPRHSIWGLAWSINRIEARQIINHHQAQNGVMACFLVNSRVSPMNWWVELQVSDWIYSSQGQRFAAYSPMAGQGRWQHWQAGIGWWMAGAWLVVVSSPFLNLEILQATRVKFFICTAHPFQGSFECRDV